MAEFRSYEQRMHDRVLALAEEWTKPDPHARKEGRTPGVQRNFKADVYNFKVYRKDRAPISKEELLFLQERFARAT